METFNNISPELAKKVNEARPKPGQTIYFNSLRPKAGGTTILPRDRIWDPYIKDEKGKDKGDWVDIAYITGQLPATGALPARHQFGTIQFRRISYNVIGVSGNNKADSVLFMYLFLTNYNKANIGKPWYAPSDGQGSYFEMVVPEKTAEEQNKFRRKRRQAEEKIDNMPDSKLLDFSLALELQGITEFSKMEEIRNKLYAIADKNPERIQNMDKDVNMNMKLLIKEAIKFKIWEEDKAKQLFLWADTKDYVFLMSPGQDLYAKTIEYLKSAGQDTYTLVKELIEKAKTKESKKKGSGDKEDGTVGDAVKEAKKSLDNAPDKKFVVPELVEVKED